MRLKDYYKTLELLPSAQKDDIKKAYRRLAFKYHPDTNPDNAFAAAHFKELNEAYTTLSDGDKRKKYDEERWLSGMSKRMREQEIISPEWILKESSRLSNHMLTIDTHRMSHQSLHDYIFLILSDSHMGVLEKHADLETNHKIIQQILNATRHIQLVYMQHISERLQQLAGNNETLKEEIIAHLENKRKEEANSRMLPWVIIIVSVLLAALMYLYGKKN